MKDAKDTLPREVLPIPDRKPLALTTYSAKDPSTKFPPIRQLRPPSGAPNVLIVLLDDVGFGASSAFGGPCRTPTGERLAAAGLKYTRFQRPRCARRRAPRCCRDETTTPSAWAGSPRSPPPPLGTTRCDRTPARRWRKSSG